MYINLFNDNKLLKILKVPANTKNSPGKLSMRLNLNSNKLYNTVFFNFGVLGTYMPHTFIFELIFKFYKGIV